MSRSDDLLLEAAPPPTEAPSAERLTVVRPAAGWIRLNLGELWEYRELIYFLIWRSLKVRYKQTVLGAVWAILQPFLTMVVFSIFLGRLARVPSDGLPYPLFVYCGLVPWLYFTSSLSQASNSLIEHERMLTKVYVPRLSLPLAAVANGLVDLLLSFTVLIGMMVYYHVAPTPALAALPLFVLLAAATALGAGLWLAALNVQYRDVRFTLPFLIQFWLFSTPVVYPSSLLPEPWRTLYGINPMAGVVEGFRWALLGTTAASHSLLVVSTITVAVVLVGGLYYFRRTETTFADVV
jgi:lipopolysaccharide transport system permease protein